MKTIPPAVLHRAAVMNLFHPGFKAGRPDAAERDAYVLWRRFCCDPMPTQRQVAGEIERSVQRVRQMEGRGLRRIRHGLGLPEQAERRERVPQGTRLWLAIFGDLV